MAAGGLGESMLTALVFIPLALRRSSRRPPPLHSTAARTRPFYTIAIGRVIKMIQFITDEIDCKLYD